MKLKGFWTQTAAEKLGTVDGLNLFFGALLGANLGTLDAMPIAAYAKLITMLAFAVITIRLVATSERRWYPMLGLALYGTWLGVMAHYPASRPVGKAEADFMRLAVTLAIWIATALLFEFWPTQERPDR